MCGILGMAAAGGGRPSATPERIVRARDLMLHRGPDGEGLWEGPGVVLAHRRLSVIDPTPAGAQPMLSPDGRSAIVYNGELYNDAELRAQLAAAGAVFRGECDTETLLAALAAWGEEAIPRLRGMYAFAFYDSVARRLVLARDPLGIKPLYYRLEGREVAFASEPRALLALSDAPVRPDPVAVSAYLTTIRTVLGDRTLFEGIRTLRPGEILCLDLSGDSIIARSARAGRCGPPQEGSPAERVRTAVGDSVVRHLRSDVPLCCLLSGGLDSTILATVARRHLPRLHTYCSGARGGEDMASARLVAQELGTEHVEAPVSRELFGERWREMVAATGMPLSTPNEVAINEVARRMRAHGMVVTLSGEGADELFGGYPAPMAAAAAFEAANPGADDASRGRFQLESSAWVPVSAKSAVVSEGLGRALEGDDALVRFYEAQFAEARSERADADPLQAHLRFHRRMNLAGLLARLDSATMLAGVEGRTPLADWDLCALAESLPMREKFRGERADQTKRVLRSAFADLPARVLGRPKASFPLPFESWVADRADVLRRSGFAGEVFSPAAIETVASRPRDLWQLAWPMINIAMWGERWWG